MEPSSRWRTDRGSTTLSRFTAFHIGLTSVDANAIRKPGIGNDDVPFAAVFGDEIVNFNGVRPQYALDALRRAGHSRRLAIDENVISIFIFAADDFDTGGATSRRDRFERDLQCSVSV